MIDSGLRLLICSPKNSHVACELQIIVKNTQSLTYTCTYNKVVIKCTYKKKSEVCIYSGYFLNDMQRVVVVFFSKGMINTDGDLKVLHYP